MSDQEKHHVSGQTVFSVALELLKIIKGKGVKTWSKEEILNLYRECLWCTTEPKKPDHIKE